MQGRLSPRSCDPPSHTALVSDNSHSASATRSSCSSLYRTLVQRLSHIYYTRLLAAWTIPVPGNYVSLIPGEFRNGKYLGFPGARETAARECKPNDDENNYRILQKNTNTSCSLPLLWHLALLVHLTHMLRFSSYSSNVTTACVISRDTQSKVLRPTQEKMSHFGDVLPSQSLGSVLRKPNPTKLTTQNQSDLNKRGNTQKYKLKLQKKHIHFPLNLETTTISRDKAVSILLHYTRLQCFFVRSAHELLPCTLNIVCGLQMFSRYSH